MKTILLCSDLDRTLIPNGRQAESPGARQMLSKLAGHPNLQLAYVSGRDQTLVKKAISTYGLPQPNFVIGDVGTTLYHLCGENWQLDRAWQDEIGQDWQNRGHNEIAELMKNIGIGNLRLQAPDKQSLYKISFFTDLEIEVDTLRKSIADILNKHGISANLIWSCDEAENIGLLDILPSRANKLHAIRHLVKVIGIDDNAIVFAGDSGNDLDALTSGLPSILVKNAADDVRRAALDQLAKNGWEKRLYLAKGGFKGMNGNYAAGVVEGVVHFFPEIAAWMDITLNFE